MTSKLPESHKTSTKANFCAVFGIWHLPYWLIPSFEPFLTPCLLILLGEVLDCFELWF